MGFTTGFTGGVTLTLGLAYLTVLTHERNRQAQAQQLRLQSRVLTSLLEPTPLAPPQTRAELAREERGTLIETAKDRWNEEIEGAVRWVQRTDWEQVRENIEGNISRLLASDKAEAVKQESGAVVAKTKEASSRIVDAVRAKEEQAVAATKQKVSDAEEKAGGLRDAAKAKASRAGAEAKTGAHDAADSIRSSGGTVDAARGAVRDVISRGIQKGKEVIGKAEQAIGVAEDKIDSKLQGAKGPSDVERALQQRYQHKELEQKSLEKYLEDRYKPIDP